MDNYLVQYTARQRALVLQGDQALGAYEAGGLGGYEEVS